MQDTDERLGRALNDFYDLTFTTLTVCLFACDSDSYGISIESAASLGCLDEDIVLRVFRYNEGKSLTSHLNSSDDLREYLFLLFTVPTCAGTGTRILLS